MSQLLERNLTFLQELSEANPEEAQHIIQESSDDNILALTELAINILKGKLDISVETYIKLKIHSDLIRKLAKKSVSTKTKRKWLVRSIELLPFLLTPLLSCIGSCIARKVAEGSVC